MGKSCSHHHTPLAHFDYSVNVMCCLRCFISTTIQLLRMTPHSSSFTTQQPDEHSSVVLGRFIIVSKPYLSLLIYFGCCFFDFVFFEVFDCVDSCRIFFFFFDLDSDFVVRVVG